MEDYVRYRNMIFIVIIAVVLIITNNLTCGEMSDKRVRENHVVVCGHIMQMRTGKGTNVIYEFFYNGKRYEENKSSPSATYEAYKNGSSQILIVFQKDDPENNRILSEDEDFLFYRVSMQDTLNVGCR